MLLSMTGLRIGVCRKGTTPMGRKDVSPIQIEFDAFMRRTIRNAVKGFLKKKKQENERREEMLDIDDLADVLESKDAIPDYLKNCVKAGNLLLLFDGDYMAEAFSKLKDEQKIAIALHFFLGLDNEKAGEYVNKNPEAFRKCLERAVENLKNGGMDHRGKR